MSNQTVSVNFVAKSDQFLNPVNQMSKATGQFSNAGKIAKDVMIALGVAGVALAASVRLPENAMKSLATTFSTGFAKIAQVTTAGVAIAKEKLTSLGVTIDEQVGSKFAKNALLNVASLGFMSKAIIASGLAIAGGLYLATKSAIQFQVSMQNVQSILQLSSPDYEKLTQSVLKVSQTFPVAANDVASAVYKIGSAGFTTLKDVTELMNASALGATAGLSSMSDAASTLVTVINAYGLTAADAAHVNDILFQGVKLGQFSFSELAGQLTSFIALAKNSGASLEETIGTYALISKATGNAAESATYLSGVLRALIKPSSDLSKAFTLMGFSTGQMALNNLGLVGTIRALGASVDGNVTSLSHMFPNVRALNGVLAVLNTSVDNTNSTMGQFTNALSLNGAAHKAYEIQLKAVGTQVHLFATGAQAIGIEIGRSMLPVLGIAVTMLAQLVKLIESTPESFKVMLGIAAALAAGLLILGGSFLFVRSSVNLLKAGVEALKFTGIIDGIKNASSGIGFLSTSVGVARTAFMGLASAMGPAVLALAAIQAVATFNDAISHVDAKVKNLSVSMLNMGQSSDDVWKVINQGNFTSSKGIFGAIDTGYKFLFPETEKFNISMRSVDVAAELLAKNGNLKQAQESIQKIIDTISKDPLARQGLFGIDPKDVNGQAKAVADLTAMFPHYNAAVADAINNAKLLAAANGDSDLSLDAIMKKYGGVAAAAIALGDADQYLKDFTDGLNKSELALQSTMNGFTFATGADALSTLTSAHQAAFTAANATATAQAKQTPSAVLSQQYAVQRAIMAVSTAQDTLNLELAKTFTLQIKVAEQGIAVSYDNTAKAVYSLSDATKALNDLRKPPPRTVSEAEIALRATINGQADAVAALVVAQDKLKLARDHASPVEIAQAQRDLVTAQDAVTTSGYAVVDAQTKLNDLTKNTPQHQRDIAEATFTLNDAQRSVANSADATVAAQQALVQAYKDQAGQPKVITAAQLSLAEAVNGVTAALEAQQTAAAGPKAAAAAKTFDKAADLMTLSLQDLDKELQIQIKDSTDYWKNIDLIAQRYGKGVADEMIKMGKDGAGAVAKLATDTNASGQQFASDLIKNAAAGTGSFKTIIQENMSLIPGMIRTYSAAGAQALADEMGIGTAEAGKILDAYGLKLKDTAGTYYVETSPGNFIGYNPLTGVVPGGGPSPLKNAMGNVYENHQAQISNKMRLWAEPETGGEAYIPLHPSKRKRSKDLLQQVAAIFGMNDMASYAAGDILPPALKPSDFSAKGNKKILVPPAVNASVLMRQNYAALLDAANSGFGQGPGGGPSTVSTPAGPSPWTSVATNVATLLNQLGSVGAIIRRINFESGGNPNAVNRTDSNWIAGHPSVGLAQVIAGTFRSNAGAFINTGPFMYGVSVDPMANVYAGMEYATRRYGSIAAIDPLVRPVGYDQGGYLPPKSRTLAVNNTSHWEPVGRQTGPATVIYQVPVNVDARVAANIDLNIAGEIIARQVTRGIQVALQETKSRVHARNGR